MLNKYTNSNFVYDFNYASGSNLIVREFIHQIEKLVFQYHFRCKLFLQYLHFVPNIPLRRYLEKKIEMLKNL